MTVIHISPRLARKLSSIAKRENKSIDDIAESLLESNTANIEIPAEDDVTVPGTGAALLKAAQKARFRSEQHNVSTRPGTLAALIEAAEEADISGGDTDVSSRSREILDKEFTDYLWRRMREESSNQNSK